MYGGTISFSPTRYASLRSPALAVETRVCQEAWELHWFSRNHASWHHLFLHRLQAGPPFPSPPLPRPFSFYRPWVTNGHNLSGGGGEGRQPVKEEEESTTSFPSFPVSRWTSNRHTVFLGCRRLSIGNREKGVVLYLLLLPSIMLLGVLASSRCRLRLGLHGPKTL